MKSILKRTFSIGSRGSNGASGVSKPKLMVNDKSLEDEMLEGHVTESETQVKARFVIRSYDIG